MRQASPPPQEGGGARKDTGGTSHGVAGARRQAGRTRQAVAGTGIAAKKAVAVARMA